MGQQRKHTPGPWKILGDGCSAEWVSGAASGTRKTESVCVLTTPLGKAPTALNHADADLISVAPDMSAALDKIHDIVIGIEDKGSPATTAREAVKAVEYLYEQFVLACGLLNEVKAALESVPDAAEVHGRIARFIAGENPDDLTQQMVDLAQGLMDDLAGPEGASNG